MEKKKSKRKFTIQDMTFTAVFAVIIAICSWISIPTIVPFTLQTFAVFTSFGVLGGKKGTLSVVIYILLGSIGIPVFAGFSAGLGVVLGTTGGYMLGFVFSGLLYWAITSALGNRLWVKAVAMLAGIVVCYLFGTIWFIVIYAATIGEMGIITALTYCVFPFIIPDLIKIALALIISERTKNVIKL